jgi:dCMP deaminase
MQSSPLNNSEKTTEDRIAFSSTSSALAYTTQCWQENFVTLDLTTVEDIGTFVKRPFFMLVSIDAPVMLRFRR